MQGWRRTMEDAHLAVVGLADDPSNAIFGVFDGHGGAEVAKFCQKYMAQEIQKLKEFEKGKVEDCLIQLFHRMDEMLRDQRYAEELEQLKTKDLQEEEEGTEKEADGVSPMDALEMLKRVFQLKRFMGDNTGANENGAPVPPGEGAVMDTAASAGTPMEDIDMKSADVRIQAGCTAVVALKVGKELYVANAGDSRGILCRGGKAIPLSEDHKPAQEREKNRILSAGGFLSEIGGVCRVNGNLNLSRAIGDLKYKSNAQLHPKDQIITAQPDVKAFVLQPEDQFMVLACDGVWDVMSNQEVVDFVKKQLDQKLHPTMVACNLLDNCLAGDPREARGVGCDNMTAIVVQLQGLSG